MFDNIEEYLQTMTEPEQHYFVHTIIQYAKQKGVDLHKATEEERIRIVTDGIEWFMTKTGKNDEVFTLEKATEIKRCKVV